MEMYEVPGDRLRELSKGMKLEIMIQQCVSDSTRWFPGKAQRIENLVLAVAGEVGEVANIVKKVVRGSITMEEAIRVHNLPEEIIDTLIYLCNLMGAKEFAGIDWEDIWRRKREYNESRFTREPWFPEGDERV